MAFIGLVVSFNCFAQQDTAKIIQLNEVTISAKSKAKKSSYDHLKIAYPVAVLYCNTLDSIDSLSKLNLSKKEFEKQKAEKVNNLKIEIKAILPNSPDKEVGIWIMRLVARKRKEPFYISITHTNSKFTAYTFFVGCKPLGIDIKETYEPNGKDLEIEKLIVHYETTLAN